MPRRFAKAHTASRVRAMIGLSRRRPPSTRQTQRGRQVPPAAGTEPRAVQAGGTDWGLGAPVRSPVPSPESRVPNPLQVMTSNAVSYRPYWHSRGRV